MALPRAGVTGTFLRRVPEAGAAAARNWELLAEIVNSLQKRGELVQESRGQWTIRGPLTGQDEADVLEGENKSGGALVPGQAVAVHSSGTGFVLADATGDTLPAAGFVVVGAAAAASITVTTDGLLTLTDWSALTTEAGTLLAAHAVYFLSTTAGKITTTPPTTAGNVNHYVGRAVGPQTLEVEIGYPILL